MKLTRILILTLLLMLSTSMFAATEGCGTLVGTWQGIGTVNNQPGQPVTLNITGMQISQNQGNVRTYMISGTLNKAQLSSSICTEAVTPEGVLVQVMILQTNAGIGQAKPSGNAITPTTLNINGSGFIKVQIEKAN